MKRKSIGTVVLLIVVLAIGVFLYQKYRVAPSIKFHDLELTDLNGQPVRLEDYHGKKLFLNFFATWCGPCVGEFPALDNASQTLKSDGFVFISISDEPLALLNSFNARVTPSHIIILHSAKKMHDLGVFTVPTNYLVNGKGQVVFEKTGEQNWDQPEILGELKRKAD
jgi:thiol-disulfide isomerase/thioredoxin